MEDIADALRHEAKICSLTPDQEVQRHVEQLTSKVIPGATAPVVGDPDVGLLPEVGAPRPVVFQQLPAEPPEHAGVKRVDVVRRRREAHLSVGEVENQMLALVPNVVTLESEKKRKPIEEVHVLPPLPERGSSEVPNCPQRRHRRADLGEAERRVVCEEVVQGNDVERLIVAARSAGSRRRRVTVAETHSMGIQTLEEGCNSNSSSNSTTK